MIAIWVLKVLQLNDLRLNRLKFKLGTLLPEKQL